MLAPHVGMAAALERFQGHDVHHPLRRAGRRRGLAANAQVGIVEYVGNGAGAVEVFRIVAIERLRRGGRCRVVEPALESVAAPGTFAAQGARCKASARRQRALLRRRAACRR